MLDGLERKLTNIEVWRLMIVEVQQKAICKYGEDKYVEILVGLSEKSETTIKNFFEQKYSPVLSTYSDLLILVDENN